MKNISHLVFYVWVDAADGPVLVPHSEREYRLLWEGVDREAAVLHDAPLAAEDDG